MAMQDDRRLNWFKEVRFGMFIHWGLYSILARGEWVMDIEKIPADEYALLTKRFNPKKFSAEKWVSLAKEAGMRYLVFTTKHHDGFCLFNSQLTNYTSMNTPAKRDFVKELANAAHRIGVKLGFYYSLMDWHHPDYRNSLKEGTQISKKYIDYFHGQVRELCTNYGKVGIFWFDGDWHHTANQWQSDRLLKMIHKLQPGALVNDRLGKGEWGKSGDFSTVEQYIPTAAPETKAPCRPWESCMTINDNWGYSAGDRNWKSTRQLIQNLIRCVANDGNFLFNIDPKADGMIPSPSIKRLKELSKWMEVNKEAIYGCGKAPFGGGTVGLTTAKGNTVYLHTLRWPGEEICIGAVKNKVKSAYLLSNRKKVRVVQKSGRLFLRRLPHKAPDPYDSVIVLKMEGLIR